MRAPAAVAAVVAAVVLGGVVLPAAAVGSFGAVGDSVGLDLAGDTEPAGATATDVDRSDDSNVSPGQRLAGVIGVQGEEIGSEVSERRFAVRFETATSDESRAAIVAEEVETLRDRLDRLRAQRNSLRAAVRNGSITPGEFRARTAVLAANISSTQRMLNNSALAAASLPEERLAENGVDVSRIERLRRNASELGGPEVAEIARDIAGPEAGREAGPPEDRGPPEGIPGNVSDVGPPGNAGPPDGNESEAGPPEDAGPLNSNESDAGPPENAGPPSSNESEVGPPEDVGPPDGNESEVGPPENAGPPDNTKAESAHRRALDHPAATRARPVRPRIPDRQRTLDHPTTTRVTPVRQRILDRPTTTRVTPVHPRTPDHPTATRATPVRQRIPDRQRALDHPTTTRAAPARPRTPGTAASPERRTTPERVTRAAATATATAADRVVSRRATECERLIGPAVERPAMAEDTLRATAGDLNAEEILTALDEGRRVVLSVERFGTRHDVTLRHDGQRYYCDTPTTLHRHETRDEMRRCITEQGYIAELEEVGDDSDGGDGS